MSELRLKDSQFLGCDNPGGFNDRNTTIVLAAINSLKNENINVFSLAGNTDRSNPPDYFLDYQINGYKDSGSSKGGEYNKIPIVKFFTSHYIGFYSTTIQGKAVSISIAPRFGYGSVFFNYFLSYAYGLYVPDNGVSGSPKNQQSDCYWMMAMLWRASLEKALSKSQTPKQYLKRQENRRFFRGKLNLSNQIKYNLIDQSRFYCDYKTLSMDIPINRAIRTAYDILTRKGCSGMLVGLKSYDQRLESFGVGKSVLPRELDRIAYSRLNIAYKPVIELSKAILNERLDSTDASSASQNSFSYFLDLAELWENYLLKVLQRNLPDYNIYSPNQTGGDFLIEGRMRSIRPDILIEKEGEVVAVLDAKYKRYKRVGRTANSGALGEAVSRDDLYQMMTYLYHYGKADRPIVGLFVTPEEHSEDKSHVLAENENHRIGIMNLNIRQFEDNKFKRTEIRTVEEEFSKKIDSLLASMEM